MLNKPGIKALHYIVVFLIFVGILSSGLFTRTRYTYAVDSPWDQPGHPTTDAPALDPTNPPDDDTGDEDEEEEEDECEEDCNNECEPDATGSPVYVKSGNLSLTFIDVEITGTGPKFRLSRTYHSHDMYNGPLGYGWVSNLTVKLIKTSDATGEYVIIRKPQGRRLTFIKDETGNYSPTAASVSDTLVEHGDGSFTLNCKSCSRGILRPAYVFDSNGNLISIVDRNDNSLDFNYDPDYKLTVTSSTTGRSLTFSYGENDKISTVTGSFGRIWKYTYDANDNLISVTDPLNYAIFYEYDSNHKLLSVTDKSGNVAHVVTYDDQNRVATHGRPGAIYTYEYYEGYTTKTDPLSNTFTYYYDGNGNITKTVLPDGNEITTVIDQNVHPTSKADANGNTWSYTYNEFGQILTETDPLGNTTTYTYDPRFQKVATKTDPRGAIWTYQYDDFGNLVKITDPLLCETIFTHDTAGRILTITDALENTYTNEYDANGNLIKVTDLLGNYETYTYDDLGRKLSYTDRRGYSYTYTYDLLGRLIEIENPLGDHRTFTYDGNGNKLSETDENGNTTTYTYDSANHKTSETDAIGNETVYTYDVVGNVLSITDPIGSTTTYTYNNRYQITSITDPLGNTTSYTYDNSGNKLTKADGRGNVWTYTYDANDRLLSEADPLGNTSSYEYDEVGNKIEVTDPEGKVTYFIYDLAGHFTKSIVKMNDTSPTPDSDDLVTLYTYDCLGRRETETGAEGYTTTWTFDFMGNVLTETNDLGEVKTYTYDENGNKLTYTTVTGNVISYTYDELNRVISVGDTTGLFESYEYDGVGNRIKTTNALGNETTATYAPFNKPETVTDARGNSTTYTYDANYNLTTVVDRLGQTTTNAYDALNRLYKVTDPLNNTSMLEFDEVGNMVRMTDANGNETEYVYDEANRLTTVTYADGISKSVVYNQAGKIISKTDQNGHVITYDRDDAYRIIQRNYPDATSYSYTYDKLGRLTSGTNAYGTVSLAYDAPGRIIAINQNGTQITYSHDVFTRTRTINYPVGKSIVETYTLRDKIANIYNSTDSMNVVSYTYDVIGRPSTKTFGNGITTNFDYNPNSRVTSIAYKNGSIDILGFQYGYDNEGNRLYSERTVDPTKSEQYLYDNAQRLTTFKRGELDTSYQIPIPDFEADYSLDGLGNWLQVTLDGTPENRTVNVMNQYTDVGGVSHIYDSNGNLVDDGVYLYTYDYENQLTKITRKSDSVVIAEYTIDALNRRVEKNVGGVITEYIYDDSRVIEERISGVTTRYYVYGIKLDEVVMMHNSGGDYYYHPDVLGSTIALTDGAGGIVESYTYGAYGMAAFFNSSGTQISSSAVGNPYLFTGRRYDEESGLYYYRARYLNPLLGRFMNPDPKGFVDGMNLYEYALSNPLKYVDPRGTSTKVCSGRSISIDLDRVKQAIPTFLSKYMDSGSVEGGYKICKECCPEGSPYAGEYVKNLEISGAATWSGSTRYIPTPWGITWDIDTWLFQSKGFIGLVARISWGLSGSFSGGTDKCYDMLQGGGCISGSITIEALFGAAFEGKEDNWVKAYVSGGLTGSVSLCLGVQQTSVVLDVSGSISGAIKGTVGVWKFTYERTFIEVSKSFGPWTIYSITF